MAPCAESHSSKGLEPPLAGLGGAASVVVLGAEGRQPEVLPRLGALLGAVHGARRLNRLVKSIDCAYGSRTDEVEKKVPGGTRRPL